MLTKPKYGGSLMISYEGQNVGTIRLDDIVGVAQDSYNDYATDERLWLNHSYYFIVNYNEAVRRSVEGGTLKFFSDIHRWDSRPPLVLYRFRHII